MASSDGRAKELIDLGDRLFTAKLPFDTLCQEIALQVYPQRADFITDNVLGEEFADHLADSYPALVCRDLSDSISAMLRPKNKQWFKPTTLDEARDSDTANAQFLEYLGRTIKTGLYDARSQFIRATKEGDRDYAPFGQCVLSMEEGGEDRDHLFMRSHHLRNCAWLENDLSVIDHLHRKDSMTARAMKRKFGEKNIHETVRKACEKEPHKKFDLRVVVMPADEYDYVGETAKGKKGRKLPFVICYIDATNGKIIREGGLHDFIYIVPRWQTMSGSQYAFSPAAMTALPDARTVNSMAEILLEAGERSVDPPVVAHGGAISEPMGGAGNITWTDAEYDGNVKDAFQALETRMDMNAGLVIRQDLREMLAKSFFVDKLRLPQDSGAKTATEIRALLEEHVRNLLPLFEPIETEYNTAILDKAFRTLDNMGKIDWSVLPQGLRNAEVNWAFQSPIEETQTRLLAEQCMETMTLVSQAQQLGIVKTSPLNGDRMLKDAVRGIGGPATWRKTDEEMAAEEEAMAMKEQIAGALQEAAAGAEVAGNIGGAAQQLQGAGILKPPPPQLALPSPRSAA